MFIGILSRKMYLQVYFLIYCLVTGVTLLTKVTIVTVITESTIATVVQEVKLIKISTEV